MSRPIKKPETSMIMVRIDPGLSVAFAAAASRLGLRRDAYLNKVLPGEIALVERLPLNSEFAQSHARKLLTDTRQKVALRLDSKIITRLNKVCEAKRIPRDAFFESLLRHIVKNLHYAANVLENPRSYWTDECEPYRELVWTDAEVESWSAGVQAIAQVKGCTFGEAQSALLTLEKNERDKILGSKAVRTHANKIRKQAKAGKPVDLADLM